MANCNDLFQDYHNEISIGAAKNTKMKGSKAGLRKRIKKWFSENHPNYTPQFYIQGSYKMKIAIRTAQDICDLDDGIYFFRQPDVAATTLKEWVRQAVDGYTGTAPENRKKCVRSVFVNDYEIDHPVYYKIDGQDYRIAVKDKGWEDSDPKAVVDWFVSNKDNDGRLVRIVKDLKGWADNQDFKMPSGLALTILATNAKNKITLSDRDDISIKDILKEIKKALAISFTCVVPATPYDDLFKDYDPTRKEKFLNALNEFIKDADEALKLANKKAASKLWRKHLGNRFPLGEDINENTSTNSALIAGAVTSKPWANVRR